ncbi:MAG: formyltransferase family protein [Sphingomicrobium sp.]
MSADIILLAKTEAFSRQARTIAEVLFGSRLQSFLGTVGDPLPGEVREARPTLLLSFLSPWIVPAAVLENAGTALNFHPASVEYPGIGCYNFALYDDAPEFGAVCHHMLPKVDSGTVVEERRFPIFPTDTVETLKLRTMVTMLAMFHDICSAIAAGHPLAIAPRQWARRAYTRAQMNALKTITTDMDDQEVARRLRAGVYPGYPGPSVTIGGATFYYPVPDRAPLA